MAQHMRQCLGVRSMTLSLVLSLCISLMAILWAFMCGEVSYHLAAVNLSPMNSQLVCLQ